MAVRCRRRERVAAEALERGERLVERGDGDDLDVVAGDLRGPAASLLVALRRRHEEVVDADLAHGRHLLGQAADRRRPCRRGRSRR